MLPESRLQLERLMLAQQVGNSRQRDQQLHLEHLRLKQQVELSQRAEEMRQMRLRDQIQNRKCVEEANQKRIKERQQKMEQMYVQQRVLMAKREREQKHKEDAVRAKQYEDMSVLRIRQAMYNLRNCTPGKYEAMKEELDEVMAREWGLCRSQKERIRTEVNRDVEVAKHDFGQPVEAKSKAKDTNEAEFQRRRQYQTESVNMLEQFDGIVTKAKAALVGSVEMPLGFPLSVREPSSVLDTIQHSLDALRAKADGITNGRHVTFDQLAQLESEIQQLEELQSALQTRQAHHSKVPALQADRREPVEQLEKAERSRQHPDTLIGGWSDSVRERELTDHLKFVRRCSKSLDRELGERLAVTERSLARFVVGVWRSEVELAQNVRQSKFALACQRSRAEDELLTKRRRCALVKILHVWRGLVAAVGNDMTPPSPSEPVMPKEDTMPSMPARARFPPSLVPQTTGLYTSAISRLPMSPLARAERSGLGAPPAAPMPSGPWRPTYSEQLGEPCRPAESERPAKREPRPPPAPSPRGLGGRCSRARQFRPASPPCLAEALPGQEIAMPHQECCDDPRTAGDLGASPLQELVAKAVAVEEEAVQSIMAWSGMKAEEVQSTAARNQGTNPLQELVALAMEEAEPQKGDEAAGPGGVPEFPLSCVHRLYPMAVSDAPAGAIAVDWGRSIPDHLSVSRVDVQVWQVDAGTLVQFLHEANPATEVCIHDSDGSAAAAVCLTANQFREHLASKHNDEIGAPVFRTKSVTALQLLRQKVVPAHLGTAAGPAPIVIEGLPASLPVALRVRLIGPRVSRASQLQNSAWGQPLVVVRLGSALDAAGSANSAAALSVALSGMAACTPERETAGITIKAWDCASHAGC